MELAKEFIKLCPSLCDKVNKAGHKPLTYWMLVLLHNKDKEIVEEILNFIASKTNMEPWKNVGKTNESNINRLTEIDRRIYANKKQFLLNDIGKVLKERRRQNRVKKEFKKTKFTEYRKKKRVWEKKYNRKNKMYGPCFTN